MKEVLVAYGRTGMTAHIRQENLLGVYTAKLEAPAADPAAEVARAMDAPFDSPGLEALARGKANAVVIASDHTRPVPSRFIMPEILRRLRAGNPEIKITILIATGCHRSTSETELREKFGDRIVDEENIVIHDSGDESIMAMLGKLPSGGDLKLNKLALDADLLVAEGFIEPHFFAGFSGGRKSILPGIAARQTVMANHCSEFIRDPAARTGILENNPIHKDMLFAAEKAKLAFIVNVVINSEKQIVKAFAGDFRTAHEAGCRYLKGQCSVTVPQADIVITSNGGYPLDQNVYQSVKGMTAGETVCRPGGVIIMASSCSDGHGGNAFYQALRSAASPQKLLDELALVPRNATAPDQWQYQILARIMAAYRVILVTGDCEHQMLQEMKLETASTLDEALEMAFETAGADAQVAVLPDGVSIIPAVTAASNVNGR